MDAHELRLAGVPAPRRRISAEQEAQLSKRQRGLLDALEELVMRERIADMTMADIAKRVNCSLRTLYAIAPSRDELLLAAADRRLRRVGRAAIQILSTTDSPLEQVRAYLRATNEAVQSDSVTLNRNLAGVSGAQQLSDEHRNFLTSVVRQCLDRAVDAGEIEPRDTLALAQVLGMLGAYLGTSHIAESLQKPPGDTANEMVDLILAGLQQNRKN